MAALVTLAVPAYAAAATPAAGHAAAPPVARTCDGPRAVAVVVDPHRSGPGADVACDRDGGGRTAGELFERTGSPLGHVAQHPGMVCTVDGRPADAPCAGGLDPDAYWSLWWSDGAGDWVYATLGVDALEVPAGGAVAFSWDDVPGQRAPEATVAELTGAEPQTGTGAEPGGEPDADPEVGTGAEDDGGDGLPAWVAPTAIGLLLVGAGAAVLRRRRAGS